MTIQSEHIDSLFARMVPDDEAPDHFDSGAPEWLVASLTEGFEPEAPSVVKEAVSKEEAEDIQKKIEEVGGKVEIS